MNKTIFSTLLLLSCFGIAQESNLPRVSVGELPPEPIPTGTCKASYSGYLEISHGGKVQDKTFTAQQIGEYVKKRLNEGYSLALYPQASGRFFIIETCEAKR